MFGHLWFVVCTNVSLFGQPSRSSYCCHNSVCLSSVTFVICARTAERIEFIFGVRVTLNHSDHVLDGGWDRSKDKGSPPPERT